MAHGKPLLREALACAARAGHARVALTVHPENPARFLYQSCGFEQVDVRHGLPADGGAGGVRVGTNSG
jgi:ribosomal protein S18 acetylase RimI-like enzyme